MNEIYHAKANVAKWGGREADYLPIHEFLDQSKDHHADLRHRSLLHNTFGIKLAEQMFGIAITNSAGKAIPVRLICEDHILQDLGRIPSVTDYLKHMTFAKWMGGLKNYKRGILNE